MRKVDSVIVIGELNAKSQCEIVSLSFLFHAVLVIANIFASACPAFAKLTCINIAVHQGTHAMIIQRVRL